jgi:peptidase E/mRNA-degrading endonuclease toxin of MazEF toxin-antitoxin module
MLGYIYMRLFLTSAGIQPETKDYFLRFLGRNPKNIKVAFIPTASNHPDESRKYVEISKNQLIELGFWVEEIDIEFFPKEELRIKLESFDIIYVNGGNTFYLLEQFKKSGLDLYIKDLLKDRIYIGTSAGSIIAAPNIEICNWKNGDKNDYKIKDLGSLSLVPFTFFVHYEEFEHKKIVEDAKINYPLEVICLSNTQAVVVENNRYEIVGKGEKVSFKSFDELDFIKWNKLKIKLNKFENDLFFNIREVWYASLGKNVGYEQDGKNESFERPFLILNKFNNNVMVGIPLTSTLKNNRFYFQFNFKDKPICAVLSQIKLIDKKRLLRKVGMISESDFNEVRKRCKSLI